MGILTLVIYFAILLSPLIILFFIVKLFCWLFNLNCSVKNIFGVVLAYFFIKNEIK